MRPKPSTSPDAPVAGSGRAKAAKSTTERAAAGKPAASATAAKPARTLPGHVPLETGLSDYGLWVELFTDADIPPLPAERRRGRIWA
jgi:cyanobactin cluster PatC/TenC/TruC protein